MRTIARGLRSFRGRLRSDTGTSLIELMVGMVLMAIFGGMFTGAVLMLNSATNKSQAISLTASQLNQAFSTLDETVRYAAAISPPGVSTTSGDWYVELRSTNTGTEVCTQLRVDIVKQQLQRRTWTVTNSVATPSSFVPVDAGFLPLASGITNGGAASGSADQPLVLSNPVVNVSFQQLTINLVAPSGSGKSLTTSRSTVTFTALDSTVPAPSAPICQEQTRP